MTGRRSRLLALIFLSTLWFSIILGPVEVHAQASRIYVDPVKSSSPQGSLLTISIRLDLGAGDTINAFDVKLRYQEAVLNASSIGFDGNVFFGLESQPLAACVDSFAQVAGGCPDLEGAQGGVVHGSQVLLGGSVSGPFTGDLFKISFEVKGTGTSWFSFDVNNDGELDLSLIHI